MSKGWIKIHRQIIDWEWYDEPNTFRLFFHLLIKANHKQNNYRGVTIEAGQIMTGFDKLANDTGLTLQKVRTSINRLKSTNEITVNSNTQGTIIQIVNYDKYQVTTDEQQTSNKPITNEQQTSNKPITTNKNVNNDNNVKDTKEKRALKFAASVKEFEKYDLKMLEAFIDYWTESNEGSNVLRFEMSKNQPFNITRRLVTWKTNEKPKTSGPQKNNPLNLTDQNYSER